MFAAAPEAGQDTFVLGVGEHGRAVHDAGLRRVLDGYLDHIDAEQGGALVTRQLVKTGFQFFLLANGGGARVVDNDLFVI